MYAIWYGDEIRTKFFVTTSHAWFDMKAMTIIIELMCEETTNQKKVSQA